MNTTTNNHISAYTANTSVINLAFFFETFQDTTVGRSDLTILTIVPPTISAEPYRKAMIANLFFPRILSLSSSPSIYISNLTATVAAYFALPTVSNVNGKSIFLTHAHYTTVLMNFQPFSQPMLHLGLLVLLLSSITH